MGGHGGQSCSSGEAPTMPASGINEERKEPVWSARRGIPRRHCASTTEFDAHRDGWSQGARSWVFVCAEASSSERWIGSESHISDTQRRHMHVLGPRRPGGGCWGERKLQEGFDFLYSVAAELSVWFPASTDRLRQEEYLAGSLGSNQMEPMRRIKKGV